MCVLHYRLNQSIKLFFHWFRVTLCRLSGVLAQAVFAIIKKNNNNNKNVTKQSIADRLAKLSFGSSIGDNTKQQNQIVAVGKLRILWDTLSRFWFEICASREKVNQWRHISETEVGKCDAIYTRFPHVFLSSIFQLWQCFFRLTYTA